MRLRDAMRRIAGEGRGALVVIRREEDDRSLVERIHQYQMEDHGVEIQATRDDANPDWRTTGTGAQILADLGIRKLRVLGTGTQKKYLGLSGYNLEIVEHLTVD
jgi:3,4-dihydroxy 2-butanone 4-phosphate synthase/GTP cyclohydrolase II